jgi:hypothetical protein
VAALRTEHGTSFGRALRIMAIGILLSPIPARRRRSGDSFSWASAAKAMGNDSEKRKKAKAKSVFRPRSMLASIHEAPEKRRIHV